MPNYRQLEPERCWLILKSHGKRIRAECVPAGFGKEDYFTVRVDRYDLPETVVRRIEREGYAVGFNFLVVQVHKDKVVFKRPPIGPFRDSSPKPKVPDELRGN